MVVKTHGDPRPLVPALRDAAARVDGNLPLYNVRTFEEIRAAYVADRRFAMAMMLASGGLTFVLAMLGVYGVLNYLVYRRTREIGIRMAIGASPGRIRWQVLMNGAVHAVGGVVIGSVLAAGSWRLVAARVPRVGELEPGTLTVLGAAMLFAALAATWLPARRATLIEPVQALRAE